MMWAVTEGVRQGTILSEIAWVDPKATGNIDTNRYANPPFGYCAHEQCGDPVACGQAMSCFCRDIQDRGETGRNDIFHGLPVCLAEGQLHCEMAARRSIQAMCA